MKGAREASPWNHDSANTMDGPGDGSCAATDVFTPEVTLFYSWLAAVGKRVRSISICKTGRRAAVSGRASIPWTGELAGLEILVASLRVVALLVGCNYHLNRGMDSV